METATEVVFETETPAATEVAPTVILTLSPDADPVIAALTQTAVETLAAETGLQVMITDYLTTDAIHAGVRIVVGIGSDLSGFAAAQPEVQFVEVDRSGAVAGGNLSVIGDPIVDEQRRAFMGGYLTALVSSDYKVAGLIASDVATTTEEVNAYVIGARFFCGLCNPKYPPYNSFPQWNTLASGSAAGDYQTTAQSFLNLGVEVVYIGQSLAAPELTGYFSDLGMKVVAANVPDVPRENWVATVVLDPAPSLMSIWSDLLSGVGGQMMAMSVRLEDTDAGLISEGRQRLFDEMLVELESGYALPEFTP